MCTKRKQLVIAALSLSTLMSMLTARTAMADNTLPPPAGPSAQGGQVHGDMHPNLYSFQLPPPERKDSFTGVLKSSTQQQDKSGVGKGNDAAETGLHWSNVDSHPGVGYRLNNNEDIHLHLGAHGAGANFALHF